MAYCIKCGAKMPDGAQFCAKCGAKLLTDEPDSTGSENKTPVISQSTIAEEQTTAPDENGISGNEKSTKKSQKKWLFIIGAAILIIAVALIIILSGKKDATQSKNETEPVLPTYGLKIGMTADEAISTLKKAGLEFQLDRYQYEESPFTSLEGQDGIDLLGVHADSIYVSIAKNAKTYAIQYVFPPDESSQEAHDILYKKMTELLGEPQRQKYKNVWETKGTIYVLDDGPGVFTLFYVVGVDTYQEYLLAINTEQ